MRYSLNIQIPNFFWFGSVKPNTSAILAASRFSFSHEIRSSPRAKMLPSSPLKRLVKAPSESVRSQGSHLQSVRGFLRVFALGDLEVVSSPNGRWRKSRLLRLHIFQEAEITTCRHKKDMHYCYVALCGIQEHAFGDSMHFLHPPVQFTNCLVM